MKGARVESTDTALTGADYLFHSLGESHKILHNCERFNVVHVEDLQFPRAARPTATGEKDDMFFLKGGGRV